MANIKHLINGHFQTCHYCHRGPVDSFGRWL